MKPKFTNEELINHMKDKGITFNLISESSASVFITNNNYYFKLASYRKNFEKYQKGKNTGKYVELDFAYLKELSTIDYHIRKLILNMCLDIEHYLKVKLVNEVSNNCNEDGYSLISDFCIDRPNCLLKIGKHRVTPYTNTLCDKYHPNYPLWAFLEIISFTDLIFLWKFYEKKYPSNNKYIDILFNVANLRNACAHNNCLINDLSRNGKTLNPIIKRRLANISDLSKTSRIKNSDNYFIVDFVTLIYIYDLIVTSDSVKAYAYQNLHDLFHDRMLKHKDYFINNQILCAKYGYIVKVIDDFTKQFCKLPVSV